ncbi:HAD family hydrolase [SAR202 cluster bacterium AC-647-N09_OGT_505m]|nr:HAD family hydrolase [SAR202 cluster bacterium AC-647-N09_OGT_505m]
MPLKAIIFDVYNTLFRNDTSSWMDTFRELCRIQDLPISPDDLWARWKSIEVRFRQTRTNLEHPEESPPFKTYQEAWREAFVDAFDSLGIRGDPDHAAQLSVDGLATREPYEDTFPFLEYVRHRWKRSVLTNADSGSILPLLQRYELSFDAVVTSEIARAYKPDPRIFIRIVKETGVLPEEALYVGDTLFDDIHGAKLAGLPTAWINRNGADTDPQLLPPDYQVTGLDKLVEILEYLKEVNPQ